MDNMDFLPKSQPKKGRRSKVVMTATKETKNDSIYTEHESSGNINFNDEAPSRPSRRQMGWDKSISVDPFDSRLTQEYNQLSDEENSDMQNIPDLDEIHEDDITQEIAAPPSSYTSKIASYGELDMDLMNRSAFRTLDGDIDLKVLVKNLASEKDVRAEEDVQWNWDNLFADVSANLRSKQDTGAVPSTENERAV